MAEMTQHLASRPETVSGHEDVLVFMGAGDPEWINASMIIGMTDVWTKEKLVLRGGRYHLHAYKNAMIKQVTVTNGEHYINEGAHVKMLIVRDKAVVYIRGGHVDGLIVDNFGTVLVSNKSSIITANIKLNGYMQIKENSMVNRLTIANGGRCVITDDSLISEANIEPEAKFVQLPTEKEEAVCPS